MVVTTTPLLSRPAISAARLWVGFELAPRERDSTALPLPPCSARLRLVTTSAQSGELTRQADSNFAANSLASSPGETVKLSCQDCVTRTVLLAPESSASKPIALVITCTTVNLAVSSR